MPCIKQMGLNLLPTVTNWNSPPLLQPRGAAEPAPLRPLGVLYFHEMPSNNKTSEPGQLQAFCKGAQCGRSSSWLLGHGTETCVPAWGLSFPSQRTLDVFILKPIRLHIWWPRQLIYTLSLTERAPSWANRKGVAYSSECTAWLN